MDFGDVKIKKFLNCVIQEELEPIRERRLELEKHIPEIYEMLKQGSIKAQQDAAEVLRKVKDAMKINYFSDENLMKTGKTK